MVEAGAEAATAAETVDATGTRVRICSRPLRKNPFNLFSLIF